jgi:predicted enzyme related to lactoylglutathione lyase
MISSSNPVVYFEIPVLDKDRAVEFYTRVFHCEFQKAIIDNNEMAIFPFDAKYAGITGALAKGAIYIPTSAGVVIYFATDNIRQTLRLAVDNGGKLLYPETDNGIGLVAEFEDTEGNRIALYQAH